MTGFSYRYPRPSVTVDCVVLGWRDDHLRALLIQRDRDPSAGCWALPGGFVDADEPLEQAARRELVEETGIDRVTVAPISAFGDPGRDPRGWTVTMAFLALAAPSRQLARAGDDARHVDWFPLSDPPALAFDHADILAAACTRLAELVLREPVAFDLLRRKFTLAELRRLYEAVLGRKLSARRFNRQVLKLDALVATGDQDRRGAASYRLDRRALRRRWPNGFQLALVDPI